MDSTKKIQVGSLNFSYLEYGEGAPIICLHGFPDSARTWDFIGPALAGHGYRIIAPFMRGYEPTDIPADHAYGALELGHDVLGLIKALGSETAIVIGHDWGALAAYAAANINPQMVKKLITLAIPHPRALSLSLKGVWRARHFIGFQFRNAARRFMAGDGHTGVDAIYRRWSPTWEIPANETAHIKKSFQDPDRLDAALGYYWSFRQGFSGQNGKRIRRTVNARTTVPTLCLVGEKDGALDLSNMAKTPACFTDYYRYEIIPGVGHFPHRESPQSVLEQIVEFLET